MDKNEQYKGNRLNRKLNFSYISVVLILIIGALVFKIVYQPNVFKESTNFVLSAFSYIIWGVVIAYFLNPIIMFFQRLCRCKLWLAMILVYFLFLGLLGIIVGVILPMIASNLASLAEQAPSLIKGADQYIRNEILSLQFMQDIGATEMFEDWIKQINTYLINNVDKFTAWVLNNAISVTNIILKFFMGLILSIYMLNDKPKLIYSLKRILYAFVDKKRARKIIEASSKTNTIFKKFIIGKTFDSLIVGIVTYIALTIMKVPMSLLLAVIITITNMIPSIGPIIGAIPCVLITLLFNPIKAIWVLAYLIVIQQIDGLWLGPKILGDTLGMSPLLIIAGVFIGGGFFGVIGMFLGAPVLASIQYFLNQYVDKQLNKKGIDVI